MTKISQYTTINTLANGDLLDISQDAGGGNYDTRAINFQNLQSSNFYSRTENLINIQEVRTASDLPATLVANTTYLIVGVVNISTNITCNVEGVAIIGQDRNKDFINFTGSGAFLTITDCNFTLINLGFSCSNSAGYILNADNYLGGSFNEGRDKVLTMFSCQFRNTYDLVDINGFDLVDINNCLIWYSQAQNFGFRFQSVSKLEISSCEFIRWFDETTIPTPSNYAIVPMIELQANGTQSGYGAVNITGCVIHPQQTQDALYIDNASTTGFGVISGNTFVTTNLSTGVIANFDFDIQNGYIIKGNQNLVNSLSSATLSLQNNSVLLDNSVTNPIPLADASTVGGGGFTNPITFPIANRVITSSANGSIEYNSKIQGNFFVTVSAEVNASTNADTLITLRFRQNGVPITISEGKTTIRQQVSNNITFSLLGLATLGDVFDIEVESDLGTDVLISNLTLNGYSF